LDPRGEFENAIQITAQEGAGKFFAGCRETLGGNPLNFLGKGV
jgi:hypothetical protein